jgi:uncharacterized integral membrane protein
MGFKHLLIAIVASAITLFALQNSGPTSVRFLLWGVEAVPLAAVILLSAAAGIVLVGLPLWIERLRLRSQARALETRLGCAEALLAERERPPGTPQP